MVAYYKWRHNRCPVNWNCTSFFGPLWTTAVPTSHFRNHYVGLILCCCGFTVVPLLLFFCLCGEDALSGAFTDIPYDTKSHLINYHTEGQGENTVRPKYLPFKLMTLTVEYRNITIHTGCLLLRWCLLESSIKWYLTARQQNNSVLTFGSFAYDRRCHYWTCQHKWMEIWSMRAWLTKL